MAEGGALRIDRWAAHYLVPAGHGDPQGLRDRLDQVVRRDLLAALARGLASLLRDHDERVCFLRRLELSVTLNAAWPGEQVGQVWSAALARALAASTGDDLVVFRDRAEYLGAFLVDLAGNRAWRRWYYGPFAGLQPLPASAAIRTALCDEPAGGLQALLRLPAADLAAVLTALTEPDAARTLDRLAAEPGGNPMAAFGAAVPAWRAARRNSRRPGGERAALATFLLACRDHVGQAGQALALAARALAALDAPARAAPDRRRRPPTAMQAADTVLGDAPFLALRACPPDLLVEVADELTGRPVAVPDLTPDVPSTAAWGGMFYLLPHLGELGLDQAAASWPGLPGASAPALLRLLVLAACGGPEHRAAILADPLARRLTGVDPWLTAAEVRAWANARPASADDALIAALDERRRAARPPVPAVTRQALVRVRRRGAPVAVLLDLDDGAWRFAGRFRPGYLDRLLARAPALATTLAEATGQGDLLIADDALARALAGHAGALVETPDSPNVATRHAADTALTEGIARLGQVPEDLAHLLGAGPAAPVDCAVAVAAQHALQAFGRRLPGFARSSLPYLARNFLDAPATLTEADDRRLVRIGRPPLGLVLALTGAQRDTYRLSWLDDRPLMLFPEGDD